MSEKILGIKVTTKSKKEILQELEKDIKNNKRNILFNANPLIICNFYRDKKMVNEINKENLNIPDGFGTVLASKLKHGQIKERIAGIDLFDELCKLSLKTKREAKLSSVTMTPTDKAAANAEGNIIVTLTGTLTNSGDATLNIGDEDFSVAVYNWSTSTAYDAVPVNTTLAAGESTTVTATATIPVTEYLRQRFDLKENGRKLPCGIVAMSPWTDMTASGPSYQENFENDPLFGGTEDSMIYNREYSAGEDLTNPYLSPLFGEYEGFPPMLIQVGSCEMLLSDSVLLAQKAKEAGVKVRLSIYEGMFHVFQMAPLTLPECKRAWVEIGHFIDEIDGTHESAKQTSHTEMNERQNKDVDSGDVSEFDEKKEADRS